jgi:hypothetical protein
MLRAAAPDSVSPMGTRSMGERNCCDCEHLLKKDEDGSLEAFEASDLSESEIGELRGYERDLAMVLSEQDVNDLAETVEPGSSAAVLVWENLWAAPFGAAVRHAGGQLAASGRIPIQAVLAAIEADAEEGA